MSGQRKATSDERGTGGADPRVPPPPDKGRFTERWLAAVMASSVLTHRAKLVAYALFRRADWTTGDNCHLSDDTIVKYAGLLRTTTNDSAECQKNTGRQCWTCDRCKAEHAARKTARRGRDDLESAGFIERTGRTTIKNVISYRLRFPGDTWDSRVPTDTGHMGQQSPAVGTPESQLTPATWDSRVPTDTSHMGQQSPAVGTPESFRWDSKVPQPPITSSDLEEVEEEEDRPTDGRAAILRQILPPPWRPLAIQTADPGLSVLEELQARGWSTSDLHAACQSLPLPRKHPTGLLVAHLRQLRTQNPATLMTLGSPTGRPPTCPHDIDRRTYCRDCDDSAAAPQLVQDVAL